MGMLSRMSTIVKSKINRIMDNAENPSETLDYSYEKQLEMLRNVKRGVVEMVTTKRRLQGQAAKAQQNLANLEIEQQKLTHAEQRLQAKVSAFKTQKEVIKAQYSAAQAQVRIGSALSGLSEEMGDISLAIERAEDKTETMRAKAGAIDELVATGVLDDPTGLDPLDRQLQQLGASSSVDDELAALKGQLPSGEKKSLPEGQS